LPGQSQIDGTRETRCPLHALPPGASRPRGQRRGDRRPAVRGVRRGGEPAARAEEYPRLVPGDARTMSQTAIPVRAPALTSPDDRILPFEVAALDLRGRVVRLGAAVDELLTRHQYPVPVAKLLGEAAVLTIMLGSSLKLNGRFILQTQTDGPVRLL